MEFAVCSLSPINFHFHMNNSIIKFTPNFEIKSTQNYWVYPRISAKNSACKIYNSSIKKKSSVPSSWRKKIQVYAMQQGATDLPMSMLLEPITSDNHFHQILEESQHPIIIEWIAAWCRKCIFLKPKIERLAAEFYPRVRFYYVDVNSVPQSLVNEAGVTVALICHNLIDNEWSNIEGAFQSFRKEIQDKDFIDDFAIQKMPTIQLWKDGKKKAEVIGGHDKAWMIVADVREMIEKLE